MVPVSRWTQLAGLGGAVAVGTVASWLLTPDPLARAADGFRPTFRAAPVIIVPPPPDRPVLHLDLVPVPTLAPGDADASASPVTPAEV